MEEKDRIFEITRSLGTVGGSIQKTIRNVTEVINNIPFHKIEISSPMTLTVTSAVTLPTVLLTVQEYTPLSSLLMEDIVKTNSLILGPLN